MAQQRCSRSFSSARRLRCMLRQDGASERTGPRARCWAAPWRYWLQPDISCTTPGTKPHAKPPASRTGFSAQRYRFSFSAISGWANALARRCDAPDHVADVVRDEQRAGAIDRYADRAAHRVAVLVDEAGEDLLGQGGRTPVGERHEDDVVARARPAVP